MPYGTKRMGESPMNPPRHPPTQQTWLSKNKQDASSSASNSKDSSIIRRPPQGLSHKLVSLISRFETLDAVSLPFTVPSLQPAPLQVSRNGSRRRGSTATAQTKRLSTIFSPARSSLDHDENTVSEGVFHSGRETVRIETGTSLKKSDTRKLRKSRTSEYKAGSIRGSMKANKGIADSSQLSKRPGTSSLLGPYVLNESPTKQSDTLIQDKIKFYDGSLSMATTRARPSLITPVQSMTPISGNRAINKPSTAAAQTPKQQIGSAKGIGPDVSTLTSQKSSTRQGNLIFGPTTPNPFLGRTSPKSTVSNVSPTNTARGRSRIPTVSTARHPPQIAGEETITIGKSDGKQKKDMTPAAVPEDERGRGRVVSKGKDPLSSVKRRNISDKIEALYRAKSQERKDEDSRGTFPLTKPEVSDFSIKALPRSTVDCEHEKPVEQDPSVAERKESKVSFMRRMFETSLSKAPAPSTFNSPSKSVASTYTVNDSAIGLAMPLPPPPAPPLPGFKLIPKRSDAVSPKTMPKIHNNKQVAEKQKIMPKYSIFPNTKAPQPKGSLVGDRLKLFETKRYIEQKPALPTITRKETFTRKMNRSIKSLFDPRKSSEEKDSESRRALTGSEVKGILNELTENKWQGSLQGKGNDISGKWNVLPTDGAMSGEADAAGSPDSDDLEVLIIKEVDCVLTEPKPLRVVEMKRMILLCRERVGREKGRSALDKFL